MEVRIDGLEDLLRRVVREEITRDRDGWLDARDAAEYLCISSGTLHGAVSADSRRTEATASGCASDARS